MKKITLLPVLLAVLLTSCSGIFGKRVRGNGHVITETRNETGFTGVRVSGAIDLYVRQDSSTSVKIEVDENLQPLIITEKEGNILIIRQKNGVNLKPTRSVKVYVAAPVLEQFYASGACDIFGEGRINSDGNIRVDLSGASEIKMDLRSPKVEVFVSGAGTVRLSGETKDFLVEGSGSTDVKCFDLLAENASVDISGAGDAEVFASVRLNVDVSGAADVNYKGAATVTQHVSGAGSVKKKE